MKTNQSLMKIVLLGTLFLLLIADLSAQHQFTATQYQEDLRFLQENIHKNFSFLLKRRHPKPLMLKWKLFMSRFQKWPIMKF